MASCRWTTRPIRQFMRVNERTYARCQRIPGYWTLWIPWAGRHSVPNSAYACAARGPATVSVALAVGGIPPGIERRRRHPVQFAGQRGITREVLTLLHGRPLLPYVHAAHLAAVTEWEFVFGLTGHCWEALRDRHSK